MLALLGAAVCPGSGLAGPAIPSRQPAATAVATNRDNGHTVGLRRGQRLAVVLSSTYWQLQASSNSNVLRSVGVLKISPRPGCVPGAGCGTASATYLGVGTGRATVTATRTSCGEAMGCTPAASRFTMNVVVR
jgi:hypothetical protein